MICSQKALEASHLGITLVRNVCGRQEGFENRLIMAIFLVEKKNEISPGQNHRPKGQLVDL